MRESVQQRRCHLCVAKYARPLAKVQAAYILGELEVEISTRDRVLTLSDTLIEMPGGVPAECTGGVPLVGCEIGGEAVRCFFDTGAPLSYLAEGSFDGAHSLGEVEDFHPFLGRFQVPTYAVAVQGWGQSMRLKVGQMPELLTMALGLAGADGILGTEILEHGVLRLSQRQERIALVAY